MYFLILIKVFCSLCRDSGMLPISCRVENVSLFESFIPTSETCVGPVSDSRSSVELTLPAATNCVGQQLGLTAGNVVSTGFNLDLSCKRGPKYDYFFQGCPKKGIVVSGKVGLLILPVRLTHRGSWRPKSVTTKPNSSPPKRKRNIRWTRWPWSWS